MYFSFYFCKDVSLTENIMHLSMLSRWGGGGGRPGIGGGFDSSHHPVVGTFDRFNGFCSNILLTFSLTLIGALDVPQASLFYIHYM